ncbi:MAG: 3-methyl-2-oxobutanoate dehydrogenase subunit VorB [Dysgonamonadaceae bacterium]
MSDTKEIFLMKGNEALAHTAIRIGVDGYFGYPITPQSEIIETLMAEAPWSTTGMVVLQAESEVAAINMVYGGAGCGKKVITSSSSPGVSLKQEGISYIAGADLPCVLVNVMRGGPGLGIIQPSQGDYFQAVKGGGNGDYHMLVLAPASVQEMSDFLTLGFELAFKYRHPVMLLTDGVIGQMMEKVELPPFTRRRTDAEIERECPWATLGKPANRQPNIITSLELDTTLMEQRCIKAQEKYAQIQKEEVRYEGIHLDDADYVFVAFGASARVCLKAMEFARAQGVKVGMFRPITLWPYPSEALSNLAPKVKGFLTVEMNAGQMLEDVKLAVLGKAPVKFFGRLGGVVPSPEEVYDALKINFNI